MNTLCLTQSIKGFCHTDNYYTYSSGLRERIVYANTIIIIAFVYVVISFLCMQIRVHVKFTFYIFPTSSPFSTHSLYSQLLFYMLLIVTNKHTPLSSHSLSQLCLCMGVLL